MATSKGSSTSKCVEIELYYLSRSSGEAPALETCAPVMLLASGRPSVRRSVRISDSVCACSPCVLTEVLGEWCVNRCNLQYCGISILIGKAVKEIPHPLCRCRL